MTVAAGLYTGVVRHTRLKPKKLSLRHGCFWLAADIDSFGALAANLWNFSYNRFNLLSFHDCDHGSSRRGSLRAHIEQVLADARLPIQPANIMIFCMPRVIGYGFNPLTLYFCQDREGRLQAIVYEVHNTFGERHSYVAPVACGEDTIRQTARKSFYVSPFMDMDLVYSFKLHLTDERIVLAITAADDDGPVIVTSVRADRRELNSQSLLGAWLTHPLLTLKVIAAIHFHAARLWLRGIKLRLRPPPPERLATLGQPRKPAT